MIEGPGYWLTNERDGAIIGALVSPERQPDEST